MSKIRLENIVALTAPSAMSAAKKSIDQDSRSLSTGVKDGNDVVSTFLGKSLDDRAKILSKISGALGCGKNIIDTAKSSLTSVASSFSSMLGIINSVSGSDKLVAKGLNDDFQSRLESAKQQIKTTKFGGKTLLTGDLGSDAMVKAKFNTKPIDVRKIGVGRDGAFETLGAKAQKNIQLSNDIRNIQEGNVIRLGGVKFTMMDPANFDENNESHIAIAATPKETAGAIVTAIKNHSSEALRIYDVFTNISDENSLVVIQQRSQSSSNISLSINSPQAGMVDNSQPSNYSFEFLRQASVGSWVSIRGIKFEYVANGSAGGDPTKVEIGMGGYAQTGYNLRDAIMNHPVTKELIDEKLLSITANNFGAVNIKSTLDKSLLQFDSFFQGAALGGGEIRSDTVFISAATTYSHKVSFNTAPNASPGESISINIPSVGIKTFPVPARAIDTPGGIAPSLYTAMIADPDVIYLYQAEKLSIEADQSGNLTIYSDYDLKLTYTPADDGTSNATDTPTAISPNDVSVIKAAIDVSKISNIDGFIGTPKAEFRVIAQATGVDAENLYKQSTSESVIPGGGAVNDNDSVAIVEVNIAGRAFQSTVWRANGGNLNNASMVFTEGGGGESFVVRTRNFDADFTSLNKAQETLAAPLKVLFESTVFAQTRDLDIDTSNEKIITDEGGVIGDITGMTASLNSTDFTNKEIQDFAIIPNPYDSSEALFTAKIGGVEFVARSAVAELSEGSSIKLMASNDDCLTINIGKDGLNSLNDPQNYKYISAAIKKSLMKIGSGLDVRVGVESSDSFKLVMPDMSVTKLYRNNQNEYIPKLDLLTKENVNTAREVITRALGVVRSAISNIQGQSETIDSVSEYLTDSVSRMKDASSQYLDADIVESSTAFSAAVKSIQAAIYTLQAGARVSDAALQIIQAAAAA